MRTGERRLTPLLTGLVLVACGTDVVPERTTLAEPDPVQAGRAPESLPYAPGVDVQHYDFEISLMEGADWFAGRAGISLTLTDPLPAEIALDLTGLAVTDFTIDGTESPFRLDDGRILFGPGSHAVGEEITVGVTYEGIPDDGLILGETRHGVGSVFADNWPNRARFWIPTVDHPSDKATVRFTVHAPDAWQVIAPGRMVAEPSTTARGALGGSGGRRTWIWEMGVPVSPYNMVIGATEFAIESVGVSACKNAPESPRDDNCVDVSYWVFPPDADTAAVKFGRAADMVEHFTWTIGTFPFEKLANVQSATQFGGMENASAIFYSERGVAESPDDGVVSHEIAHQWFGDAVTEARWSHLWLSEGFATYFGALYFADAVSPADFRRRMEGNRVRYVESDDVDNPVIREEADLFDLLNRNNYQKGGWVLHMLRFVIGEQAFGEVIRRYYNRFRHQAVLTEDFRAVAEEVHGESLEWFFRQWLYEPGHPRVRLTREWDAGRSEVVLTLEQVQDPDWPTFRFDAIVELRHSTGAARRLVSVTERRHTYRLPLAVEPSDVVFDPDAWLLKEIVER